MTNIKLWEKETPFFNEEFGQEEPSLTPFILPTKQDENGNVIKRGCVIVCQGGAYQMRAEHEGAPVCEMLNNSGISSFVLNYRLNPYYMDAFCADIKRAVRHVRYHADEYGIDPEKIAVLGFSAGGHLSSVAATHFDYGMEDGDEIDKISCRPNAAILCYPLISFDDNYNRLNVKKLFFAPDTEFGTLPFDYSGENNVKEDTPPMFLWHTAEDNIIPVEQCLNMATALSARKIPFELHVFERGAHGLGLAEDDDCVREWGKLAVNWLKRMKY